MDFHPPKMQLPGKPPSCSLTRQELVEKREIPVAKPGLEVPRMLCGRKPAWEEWAAGVKAVEGDRKLRAGPCHVAAFTKNTP